MPSVRAIACDVSDDEQISSPQNVADVGQLDFSSTVAFAPPESSKATSSILRQGFQIALDVSVYSLIDWLGPLCNNARR